MRNLPALIAAAGLVAVSLTACTAGSASACEGGAPSGEASTSVEVTGELGSAPTVDFPTPLRASETQSTVVSEGTGAGLVEGQKVVIDMSVYNGSTGELIEKTEYAESPENPLSLVISDSQVQSGLVKGLTCATEGSRIVVVVPPEDAFGDAGNSNIGVGADDDLVFVIDVNKAYLTRANGAPQTAQNGFPSVVLDHTGRPGITIPSADAPKDLKVAVLKKGDGPVVEKGDQVTVHYTGVLWDSKEVFDSSWENGAPATFIAASGAEVQGGVVQGFADALIGQTVGSQVIAVIPPELGYGDAGQGTVPAGATLVFVVDILGIG